MKLNTRILLGFIFITLLGIILIITNTLLNNQRLQLTNQIKDVESPLELMVEKVIGYDAMLTSNAEAALLHSLRNETIGVKEHKSWYDSQGVALDNTLKIKAPELLNKSKRSAEQKELTYGYLKQLNEINLKLVDLEVQAFDDIEKGNNAEAQSILVGDTYQEYKTRLREIYQKWGALETETTSGMRNQIITDSKEINLINLYFTITIAIIAIILSILISLSISRQLKRLKNDVDEISKGKLDIQLSRSNIFEIQNLTDSLNRILATMKLAILRTGLSKGELGLGEAIKAKEEAEENFKIIFDASKDGITLTDVKTRKFVIVNAAFCKMLGYSINEVKKLSVMDIHPKKELAYVVKQFDLLVEEKIKIAPNIPVLRKDGSIFFVEVYASSVMIEGKKYLAGFFKDISREKEAENKYKIIYETSLDARMILEPPTWKFTSGNFEAIKMFNIKYEKNLFSLNLNDLSPERQPDGALSSVKAKKMIEKAMEEGVNFFEWTHRRYKGESFSANVLLSRIDEGGKSYLQATVRDIGKEEKIKEILEMSEEKFRRLFETVEDGILLINADTAQIEEVNPYLIKMLGYSRDDFLGKKLWNVGPFKDIQESKKMFIELQKKGYVKYNKLPLETKKGKKIEVEFVSNIYTVGNKKVIQCNIRAKSVGEEK